jgi:hypothetical protein
MAIIFLPDFNELSVSSDVITSVSSINGGFQIFLNNESLIVVDVLDIKGQSVEFDLIKAHPINSIKTSGTILVYRLNGKKGYTLIPYSGQ